MPSHKVRRSHSVWGGLHPFCTGEGTVTMSNTALWEYKIMHRHLSPSCVPASAPQSRSYKGSEFPQNLLQLIQRAFIQRRRSEISIISMILFFHLLELSAMSGQSNDGDDLFTSRETWGRGHCKPGGNHVTRRDTGSWSGTLPSLYSWWSKMPLLHNGFSSAPYLIRSAVFSGTVSMSPSATHPCFGFRLQCLDYDWR